jgi:SAF domain
MSIQSSAQAAAGRNGNRPGALASYPASYPASSGPAPRPSGGSAQPLPDRSSPQAERLPRPPGRRRPGLAALAVLLIVLGGAAAGLLALRVDHRNPVLVAKRDITTGQRITNDDLAVARVAGDGLAMIPADQAGRVIGQYASTRIAAGRLIDDDMLNGSGLLAPGMAATGLSLAPGRFPASGLESGDVVQVVRTNDGQGKVISARAVIGSVQTPAEGVFGDSSQNTVVTVIVPQAEAAAVGAAGAADSVVLVLLTRGEPVS